MVFTDEQQIIDLLSPIILQYKKFDVKLNNANYKACIDDLPDFYPNYKTAAKYAERVRIHSETGSFPDTLFKNRYPNQTQKEFEYMRDNYKQNTLPVFVDYLSTNTRPFSDGNWSIEYEKEDVKQEQSYQFYVENEIEITESLKAYFRTLMPSLKAVDANGVIAIKPQEIYMLPGENGESIIDDTRLLNPQPYYYSTIQVLSDPSFDDNYVICESLEKSTVDFGGRKLKRGHIFEVYDEESIWKVVQVGKFNEYEFSVSIYYYHGSGVVMAKRLKGIPQYLNESYIYQSPFMFACDLLDRALVHDNYLNCTIANTMFPYRVRLGMKCTYREKDDTGTFQECNLGLVFDYKNAKMKNCPKCGGTGLRDRVSPSGEMLLNPSDMNTEGDVKFSGKAMEYVSPETAASEFVMKVIDATITKAYEVIKAKRVESATGRGINANATATKEILDQKAQYSAVKLFTEQSFQLYRFMAWGIGWQRYGAKFKPPIITDPTNYDFNTEQDYLSQIAQAQAAKLAPTIIQHYIYKYLQAIYFNQRKTAFVFDLLKSADRLFVLSQDDVMLKFNRGLAKAWEVILHDSALSFIDELLIQYADAEFCDLDDCTKGFFALDFSEQKRLLIEKAKEKANEMDSGATLIDKAKSKLAPAA